MRGDKHVKNGVHRLSRTIKRAAKKQGTGCKVNRAYRHNIITSINAGQENSVQSVTATQVAPIWQDGSERHQE